MFLQYDMLRKHFILNILSDILSRFQPFVDSDHVLHKYFLPREYSVILPGIAAVVVLLCIGEYLKYTLGYRHWSVPS